MGRFYLQLLKVEKCVTLVILYFYSIQFLVVVLWPIKFISHIKFFIIVHPSSQKSLSNIDRKYYYRKWVLVLKMIGQINFICNFLRLSNVWLLVILFYLISCCSSPLWMYVIRVHFVCFWGQVMCDSYNGILYTLFYIQ